MLTTRGRPEFEREAVVMLEGGGRLRLRIAAEPGRRIIEAEHGVAATCRRDREALRAAREIEQGTAGSMGELVVGRLAGAGCTTRW